MNRFLWGLAYALPGYVLLALAGYFMISTLSSNSHDRSLEAAMTAAFVFGPIGAIVGFVIGFMRTAA